jgi:hypothetical protein
MVPYQQVYEKSRKSAYGRHVEIILLTQIFDVEIISTRKVFVNAFFKYCHSVAEKESHKAPYTVYSRKGI